MGENRFWFWDFPVVLAWNFDTWFWWDLTHISYGIITRLFAWDFDPWFWWDFAHICFGIITRLFAWDYDPWFWWDYDPHFFGILPVYLHGIKTHDFGGILTHICYGIITRLFAWDLTHDFGGIMIHLRLDLGLGPSVNFWCDSRFLPSKKIQWERVGEVWYLDWSFAGIKRYCMLA